MNRTAKKSTAPRKPKSSHGVQGGSSEANRLAVAILEVLAGVRVPADAATALGVSLPRYYQLETRALEGLVVACEPRSKGKQPTVEGKLAKLERELEQARRECARQQALTRVATRSVGLKTSSTTSTKRAPATDRAGRKKRKPKARALKAAQALRKNIRSAETESVQQDAAHAVTQETPRAPASTLTDNSG